MASVTKAHFHRAALEIGGSGENDTLPYDIDARFVKENADELSELCFYLFKKLDSQQRGQIAAFINGLSISSERLLAPTGSHGFRITTKIHPFWNLYLNGLALFIAETHEPLRSAKAHSYRLISDESTFFDRERSWRAYKEAALADPAFSVENAVIVQTDISSFYEHIYHHRLENSIDAICGENTSFSVQVDRIVNQLSSGRSFGLPVGSQASRIFAEVMISPIDSALTDQGVAWHRYVDDYTLICKNQQDAYRSLSILSHVLADFGLNLNRSKTTIMSAAHYRDYVAAQLGTGDDAASVLREVDLHFDPYSDQALKDYETLRDTFKNLDIQFLLDLEKEKSSPDNFVVAQISRSLKFQDVKTAEQLCETLLSPTNLDAFRASWSKILRGIYAVRSLAEFSAIYSNVDKLLDELPSQVPHLLLPETNLLHYLRVIRFVKSEIRGRFVREVYSTSHSQAVRRACIDCWRYWSDRAAFQDLRNRWSSLNPDEQRMLWIAFSKFGEEGGFARKQLEKTIDRTWYLGFESTPAKGFGAIFKKWAEDA